MSGHERPSPKKHILFLTAVASNEGNMEVLKDPLASMLIQKGIQVSARSILDWDQPLNYLDYSHILLLRVWDYHLHLARFSAVLSELQQITACLSISNPLDVIRWNMDKSLYLPELRAVGFPVIETTYISLPASTTEINRALELRGRNDAVVLKPSISASSFSTYLLREPHALGDKDRVAIASFADIRGSGLDVNLMIQDYVPEITTSGELSIMMVAGEMTHVVRKTPRKGDFRSQAELGGAEEFLTAEKVEKDALQVAKQVWAYVEEKFQCNGTRQLLYARIDGVVMHDGKFVLMEAEFIEPWMYMNARNAKGAFERFCDRLLAP